VNGPEGKMAIGPALHDMSEMAFVAEARRLGAKFGQRCALVNMAGGLVFPLAAVAVGTWAWKHDLRASVGFGILATCLALIYWFIFRPLDKPPAEVRCPACGGRARLMKARTAGRLHYYLVCSDCRQKADTGLTIGSGFRAGTGVFH
jgi:hypothetical protein